MKTFARGGAQYRPAPFWSLNDKLNIEEMRAQMRKMALAGYGAFFLHSRVGLVTPYMSAKWLELLKTCSQECSALGLESYLYDEDMWPSGYASGEVPAMRDDFKEKALVLVEREQEGDKVVARHDGRKIVIRICKAGNVRFNGQCYIDTLNPEAVDAFLQCTHERYRAAMGELFGGNIKGIFTDEPCYGIHWFYTEPHVTYSEYLRERILREYGYDILQCCESLFFDCGQWRKIRHEYFKAAGAQFTDSFVRRYADWCARAGIAMTGHLMSEETMYEQAQWTGGVMRAYEYMTQPGIDKLQRGTRQLVTLKQLTSVCEQLNKPRALSECFAGLGQECGFAERKRIMDWQAVNGINFVNMHLGHYSLRGERKRDYPPDIFYQQPYFEREKIFSDYAARLSEVASYGNRDVKVLLVLPLYSVFGRYNPAQKDNSQRLAHYDRTVADLSEKLQRAHIDFHYGDEEIMTRHGKVENGKLRIGSAVYDCVILCDCDDMSPAAYDLLKDLPLYSVGGSLTHLGGVETEKRFACVTRHTVDSIVLALEKYRMMPDLPDAVIGCRRVGKEGTAYLLCNTSDGETEIALPPRKNRYLLDMHAGTACVLRSDTLTLLPCGSVALFEADGKLPKAWNIPIVQEPLYTGDGARICAVRQKGYAPESVRVLDENALPVVRADFYADGKLLCSDAPLCEIWHRKFYPLPDGTPYRMVYRFRVRQVPEKPVQIVIENAENLHSLTLNGAPLTPMRQKGDEQHSDASSYKDLSFTRCNLSSPLRAGVNEIVIEGVKQNNITSVGCHRGVREEDFFATEAEAVYVIGDFSVEKVGKDFAIAHAHPLKAGNVTEQGYPFYAGRIEYTAELPLAGGDTVTLGCDATCASLQVGEKRYDSGIAPHVSTLSADAVGKTPVKITLYNTLYALLGPHYLKDYDNLPWIDPGIVNDTSLLTEEPLIRPFGLDKIFLSYKENKTV